MMFLNELDPKRFTKLAAAGLRVFPVLKNDKKPAVNWTEYVGRAPSNEELRAWGAGDFNVGIICGDPSGGTIVLDVDSEEAQALVDVMQLPTTPVACTGRGKHYFFKAPGSDIRNSVNIAGQKLDIRGNGGYVVGAGSIHPTGARYEWLVSPTAMPFAEFPTKLLDLIEKNKPAKAPRRGAQAKTDIGHESKESGVDRFLGEALNQAKQDIETSSEGQRNDTLFKKAVGMARHCAGARSDWNEIAPLLTESAVIAGLGEEEIADTLQSAWVAGSAEPTAWIRIASEHVYLGAQDMFYHGSSGRDLKPTGFNGVFGHHFGGKGTFANFLLKNGYVEKVHDIDYCPFKPAGTINRDGQTWFNSFRPSDVVATEGDAAQFLDFLQQLIPDETERDHVLKMMALTVRNPGKKVRHALLLRTRVQGVGKSMLTAIWGALLGPWNVRKTNSKELKGDYHGYLPGHLLVVCEEVNLGMGHTVYNDLKDMLTGNTATINEKFLRPREQSIYATFAFLTNRPVPLLIEDSDRRIFFIDSPSEKRDPDYYTAFSAWWPSNLGVIRNYLDGIDLSKFNEFSPPPMTTAKLKLIECSRSELAQDLALIINQGGGSLDRDVVTLDEIMRELGDVGRGKTRTQISKALAEVGSVPLGQQRIAGRARLSLWCIRNTNYWQFVDPTERAQEYFRTTGLFSHFTEARLEVVHSPMSLADEAFLFPPEPSDLKCDPDVHWMSNGLAV